MAAITLSVPPELKDRMSKVDWVNWSAVARNAISERLDDIEELELRKKVEMISEIPMDDDREVKESICDEVVRSVEETIKSGKKPMTLAELDELMGLDE